MKIKKYGGSSLKDIEAIKKVALTIKNDNDKQIVVVSAPLGFTNDLINKAQSLSNIPSGRELDQIIVTGEIINAGLLTIALNDLGVNAISLNAFQAGIYASNIFGDGRIISINKDKLNKYLTDYDVLVICGFQGYSCEDFVSLGRGGSDTTAIALAKIYDLECLIYTDVDGVYTTDPNKYVNAKKLDIISYEEMLELSLYGGKVLAPKASDIAYHGNVPTKIIKSLTDDYSRITDVEHYGVRALSVIDDVEVSTELKNTLIYNKINDKILALNKVDNSSLSAIFIVGSFMLKSNSDKKMFKLLKDIKYDILLAKENLIVLVLDKENVGLSFERIVKGFNL